MTETKMGEMIADIINNDARYEVKKCNRECNVSDDDLYCDCGNKKWVPYKLGDEIHLDWEYRKVECKKQLPDGVNPEYFEIRGRWLFDGIFKMFDVRKDNDGKENN